MYRIEYFNGETYYINADSEESAKTKASVKGESRFVLTNLDPEITADIEKTNKN